MTEVEDVRFEAVGSMTISGKTFDMLEALARQRGVTPEETLRQCLARASAEDEA